MPSLGSGLSLGTLNKLQGYDFDASNYIVQNSIPSSYSLPTYDSTLASVSTTTIDPRKSINDFILGLKSLGIWDRSVCCAFRNGQNIATGTQFNTFGGFSAGLLPYKFYNGNGFSDRGDLGIRTGNGTSSSGALFLGPYPNYTFNNDVSILMIASGTGEEQPNFNITLSMADTSWIGNLLEIQDTGGIGNSVGGAWGMYADSNSLDNNYDHQYSTAQKILNTEGGPNSNTRNFIDTLDLMKGYLPFLITARAKQTSNNYIGLYVNSTLSKLAINPVSTTYFDGFRNNFTGLTIGTRVQQTSLDWNSSNMYLPNTSGCLKAHISFIGIFKPNIDDQRTQLLNLYKNTLGSGLYYKP